MVQPLYVHSHSPLGSESSWTCQVQNTSHQWEQDQAEGRGGDGSGGEGRGGDGSGGEGRGWEWRGGEGMGVEGRGGDGSGGEGMEGRGVEGRGGEGRGGEGRGGGEISDYTILAMVGIETVLVYVYCGHRDERYSWLPWLPQFPHHIHTYLFFLGGDEGVLLPSRPSDLVFYGLGVSIESRPISDCGVRFIHTSTSTSCGSRGMVRHHGPGDILYT